MAGSRIGFWGNAHRPALSRQKVRHAPRDATCVYFANSYGGKLSEVPGNALNMLQTKSSEIREAKPVKIFHRMFRPLEKKGARGPKGAGSAFLARLGRKNRHELLHMGASALRAVDGIFPVLRNALNDGKFLLARLALVFVRGHGILL